MTTARREKYNLYQTYLKSKNNTDVLSSSFYVPEEEAARLVNLQRESVDLLGRINIIPSRDEEGYATALMVGSIAARTDTDVGKRVPRKLGIDPAPYRCVRTEYDLSIPFDLLDTLTPAKDFNEKLELELARARAQDQITIGWNGLEAADQTDRVEFPQLQDVNTGWLQKIRKNAPEQVKSSATIGAGGDYASLDALVYAAIQMLAPEHRVRDDLAVSIDRDLLHTKMLESIAAGASSIEAEAALQRILSTGKLAGLPIYEPPSFPSSAVLVTPFKNLSIYYQTNSVRRLIREEPELDRHVDWFSQNEAYVVEQYDMAALVENVTFLTQEA